MSKPDDVPQEVWDSAFYKMDDFCLLHVLEEDEEQSVQQAIARAIMAAKAEEREAVAKMIEDGDYERLSYEECHSDAIDNIVSAIRSRT